MNLHLCASLECKDPRDKIHAVLGVSSDVTDLRIVPDYSLPSQELYIYVSRRIYVTHQNLHLLRYIGGHAVRHNLGIPSWSYHGLPKIEMDLKSHHPHPTTSCKVFFEEQNKVMVVRGRVLSRIRFVSTQIDSFTPTSTPTQRIVYLIQVIEAIASILDEIHNNLEMLGQLIFALAADPTWEPFDNHFDAALCLWCVCRYWAAPVGLRVLKEGAFTIARPSAERIPGHLRKIGQLYKVL
jgi:hypothetical protein